jgi:hypothetical protein
MADDKLNRLLKPSGSIDERNELAKGASDETLRKAAPYSVQAQVELERRDSTRRDALEEETLSIARRALANSEQANSVSKKQLFSA